jgi:holo-[acyl-carrier protein] synthase
MPSTVLSESSPTAPVTVGVDLVSVSEVRESVARFGDKYVDRIFTAAEIEYCTAGSSERGVAERFAARFAAKEAAFKALRYGDRATDWRSVEVVRAPDGWCDLQLHGGAGQAARERGIRGLALSMSHEGEYAIAVVTAWRSGAS